MKIYFCPKCHHKIIPPAFLKGGNVKAENGITLTCGNCKTGKVKIKLPKQTVEENSAAVSEKQYHEPVTNNQPAYAEASADKQLATNN